MLSASQPSLRRDKIGQIMKQSRFVKTYDLVSWNSECLYVTDQYQLFVMHCYISLDTVAYCMAIQKNP